MGDFLNTFNLMNMFFSPDTGINVDNMPMDEKRRLYRGMFDPMEAGRERLRAETMPPINNQAGNIFDNPFIKQELLRGLLQQQEQEPVMQFNTSNAFAPGIKLPVGNLNNIYRELQERYADMREEDKIFLRSLLKDDPASGPIDSISNIFGNLIRERKERLNPTKEIDLEEKREYLRNESTLGVDDIFPILKEPTNFTESDINNEVKNAIENNKVEEDYRKGLLDEREKMLSNKANRMNYLFPGTLDISNKDLINAAILKGSLEILKPRQPGENFASQASRALEAGLKTQLDVGALKIADAKGRTTGTNMISELRFLDESRNDLYSMMSIAGISNDGKFLFEEGGSFNNAFTSLVHDVYSKLGFEAADRFQLDVANKFKSLVKISDDKGDKLTFNKTGDETMDAALSFLVNSYNNARAEDNKPKNEGKKEEPGIVDKTLETIGL